MSVILEFTIDSDDFQLGEVLAGPVDMQLELERIVPTGDMMMPFVWVTGTDHETFEKTVRSHPTVAELLVLDNLNQNVLYRLEWKDEPTDLIEGIADSDAVVLEARGNESWTFRLRFPNHDRLSQFHNFILDDNIPIHIDRTYTLTEKSERGNQFGLTADQREALVLALQRGYFETPSEVALDHLADELGITRQSLSSRIRHGNEKILRQILLSSAADYE
jgi:predicted DNA binding protein